MSGRWPVAGLLMAFFLLETVPALWALDPPAQLSAKISYEGEHTLKSGPGLPFTALIEIWPREAAGAMEPKDWEGVFLGDLLYVSKVVSMGYSANNSEVAQLRAVIVFLKDVEGFPSLEFRFKGKKASLFLSKIGLGKEAPFSVDGKYSLLHESFQDESWWKEWGGSLVTVLLGALAILSLPLSLALYRKCRSMQMRLRSKREQLRKMEHFTHELGTASSRPEFEKIFAQRGEWQEFLAKGDPSMIKFLSLVELNQYKKEWSEEVLREIQESSRRLKGLMAVR